jgi:hypothetical protein
LLIRSGIRGRHRRSARRQLLQIVLQEADFYASSTNTNGFPVLVVGWRRSVAHGDEIDPVDRNLIIKHHVADDRFSHLLRIRDCGLAFAGSEALHLDNVAALTFNAIRHFIECIFGVLAQDGLAGTETDLGLVGGLVLVNVADHGLDRLDAGGGLLGALLRGSGLVASIDGVLIGFVGFIGGQLDTSLGTGVGVADGLAIGGGQIVELIYAITDGIGLPLYVALAGKGLTRPQKPSRAGA